MYFSIAGWPVIGHPLYSAMQAAFQRSAEVLGSGIMRQLSPTLEPFEELAAKAAQTSLRGLARLVAREILNIPNEPVDPDLREHAPCRAHPTKRADGGMYVGGLHICEPVSSPACNESAQL